MFRAAVESRGRNTRTAPGREADNPADAEGPDLPAPAYLRRMTAARLRKPNLALSRTAQRKVFALWVSVSERSAGRLAPIASIDV